MYILVGRGLGDAPSCTSTNCSAVSVNRFDKQPADLQRVLTQSFKDPAEWFGKLDRESRFALTAIFNRLCHYRVWCQVSRVLKIVPGEAPLRAAGHTFLVPGSTPSVYFETPSRKALGDALMATRRFCRAHGIGSYFHRGRISLREISGSDSLHVSMGPGDQFDAHIDKFSPVPKHPGSELCPNDPSPAAILHIVREAIGIKGGQLLPDFELTPTVPRPEPPTRQEADFPPPIVGGTWRGPVARSRTQPRKHREASPILSVDVVTRIDRAIKEQVSPDALLPSHVRVRRAKARWAAERAGPNEEAALRMARDAAEQEAGNYPDAQEFALDLAERMEQARRSRVSWVKINLAQYGSGDFSSRRAIAGQIRRIALILRNYLPDRAKDVRTIVVIFGSGNLATREEIKLP